MFKGALCSIEEETQTQIFNIYNISEVIIQIENKIKNKNIYFYYYWINKLFSEVPGTLFESEKVAGSATYKWSTTELDFVVAVCLNNEEFDYWICGSVKINQLRSFSSKSNFCLKTTHCTFNEQRRYKNSLTSLIQMSLLRFLLMCTF